MTTNPTPGRAADGNMIATAGNQPFFLPTFLMIPRGRCRSNPGSLHLVARRNRDDEVTILIKLRKEYEEQVPTSYRIFHCIVLLQNISVAIAPLEDLNTVLENQNYPCDTEVGNSRPNKTLTAAFCKGRGTAAPRNLNRRMRRLLQPPRAGSPVYVLVVRYTTSKERIAFAFAALALICIAIGAVVGTMTHSLQLGFIVGVGPLTLLTLFRALVEMVLV